VLDKALEWKSHDKGGHLAYDAVLMFKVLVLQALYNLSDEQTEYQILDRMSFMRFLGLELCDAVPEARKYKVTDASVHDSQEFENVLDPNNDAQETWADSAYRSEEHDARLKDKGCT
jgi:hypothetical protein